MRQFDIKGMSCAACSVRVEKAVLSVDGVTSCAVSLLTNSMGVEGDASDEDIISAVRAAGYSASLKGELDKHRAKQKGEVSSYLTRLVASAVFLIILMYIAMGHMVSLPLPSFLAENPLAAGLSQFLLAAIVMVINKAFFINGFKGFIHRAPNMDSLVALGSAASFIYSSYLVFEMTVSKHPEHLLHGLYFESAAMILTLITLGKMLEAHSKGKTTDAIKGLIELAPKKANVIRDGKEQTVDISEVAVGDIFVVRAGESIPVDAIIIEGNTAVNEAALTGESIPIDKQVGDKVSAATINQFGFITCRAVGVGEDTALSRIIKLMTEASATKAPIARIADRVSGIFVPIVIVIAVACAVIWLALGETFGFSLSRAISVLVVSCPCALGLATPVAIMVGSGRAAKNGILYKNAEALENAGRADVVVFDKTGTITSGKPTVTDIIAIEADEKDLIETAYSLEYKSEHPLAAAIVEEGEKRGIKALEIEDFTVLSGNGVSGKEGGEELFGGSYRFIKTKIKLSYQTEELYQRLANEGKTPLFFARAARLLGIIAVADSIKEDSAAALKSLKQMGIKTVMLTGDNQATANSIGERVRIDEVIAEVLPDGKAKVIEKFKQNRRVVMVGDGINDAPALAVSDVGIAIGAGTDIAIDAADVVLMNSRLNDVVAALKIGRATLRNIKQNLFWAFIYNLLSIPIAAGLFIYPFGIELNPMIAAATMSLSSFCVVTNALRLSRVKLCEKRKRKDKLEKILKIEGMMCMHCEARVKKCLEEIPEVVEAVVSHKTGTAKVILSVEISDEILISAVEAQGYNVK